MHVVKRRVGLAGGTQEKKGKIPTAVKAQVLDGGDL